MKGLRIHSFIIPASLATLVVVQAMVGASVRADEDKNRGWFFEAGVGTARDRNELATNISVGGSNYAARAYLGYRVWKYFGLQGGMVGFKTINYANDTTATINRFDYNGYHGKVFVSIPFNWDNDGFYALYLSGGGWRWDADIRSPNGNFRTHGANPTGSVGLLFSARTSALRLEYERYLLKPTVPAGIFINNENKLKYDVISVNFIFYM